MAILAGDALLNFAFEIATEATYRNAMDEKGSQTIINRIKAVNIISRASGASGMIGGQVVDLESEGREISSSILEYMHRCKTGALIKAPIMAAAVLCNAAEDDINCLERFADNIGLAFQIKDDILDVEGNIEDMGKATGGDAARKKSTFVTVYGLEESKRLLSATTKNAADSLKRFGNKASFLVELANYLTNRKN
jgi:geranylgeranyl diphosphate synthase type II